MDTVGLVDRLALVLGSLASLVGLVVVLERLVRPEYP